VSQLPPCVVFEDDHLLVVNKPPGWNTHSPSPYAGEGIYEWFKHREPRWSKLAIIHRLDKETSGLLVFSKTPESNRSLTQQFEQGVVRKEYTLISMRPPAKEKFVARSMLKRMGDKYASQAGSVSGLDAETEFELLREADGLFVIRARPRTGRTHQIRVHASENGFPILGDVLYGGSKRDRLCLSSTRIEFQHPATNAKTAFVQEEEFATPGWRLIRSAIVDESDTTAFRRIHGASDGFANWQIDQFGSNILSQSAGFLPADQIEKVRKWFEPLSVYHKITTPHVRGTAPKESSPQHISGSSIDGPFIVRENSVNYEINFSEGYSVGLFLDQRDNRRRLLKSHIAADFPIQVKGAEVLNTFAYTCAFSVCAALAGARVTSLDLSKKYLDWGRRNFALNNVDPAQHDFIFGDVFDWLKRLAKKGRLFDVVLLDPPTFSQSKQTGLFRAESDYGKLVGEALRVLRPGGTLFCSTNAARLEPEKFLATIHQSIAAAHRKILREHYFPQPPDFPISKSEPAYLKTAWFQVE